MQKPKVIGLNTQMIFSDAKGCNKFCIIWFHLYEWRFWKIGAFCFFFCIHFFCEVCHILPANFNMRLVTWISQPACRTAWRRLIFVSRVGGWDNKNRTGTLINFDWSTFQHNLTAVIQKGTAPTTSITLGSKQTVTSAMHTTNYNSDDKGSARMQASIATSLNIVVYEWQHKATSWWY